MQILESPDGKIVLVCCCDHKKEEVLLKWKEKRMLKK